MMGEKLEMNSTTLFSQPKKGNSPFMSLGLRQKGTHCPPLREIFLFLAECNPVCCKGIVKNFLKIATAEAFKVTPFEILGGGMKPNKKNMWLGGSKGSGLLMTMLY